MPKIKIQYQKVRQANAELLAAQTQVQASMRACDTLRRRLPPEIGVRHGIDADLASVVTELRAIEKRMNDLRLLVDSGCRAYERQESALNRGAQ